MQNRRMDIRQRIDSQLSEIRVAGVAWSEIDIIGWEYNAGVQDRTLILDSNDKSPASNDSPKDPERKQAIAFIYIAGSFAGARIQNTMDAETVTVRVHEPVHLACEDDLLIIASQSVGLQRHISIKRADGESQSLTSAYQATDPEAEALGGGPMFTRYVPGAPEGASLQIGGDWPEIQTLDGERLQAHSYLQIPVDDRVPVLEVQVLVDEVNASKDVFATALIGLSGCSEWQDKSVEEIEQRMRDALAYLKNQSCCRIVEAVITSKDNQLIRID
ncbi:MAG: hypothetical protein R3E82_03900 [Pseudomonadales bacterium]